MDSDHDTSLYLRRHDVVLFMLFLHMNTDSQQGKNPRKPFTCTLPFNFSSQTSILYAMFETY